MPEERRCGTDRSYDDLLSAAERDGFDVMLTADTNLRYQQNLVTRRIASVALSTNAWPVIRDNPTRWRWCMNTRILMISKG